MHRLLGVFVAAAALLPGQGNVSQAERQQNWLHFSVLGFEQTGASSTQSDQRGFFDFWVTRHIGDVDLKADDPAHEKLAKPFHWWGNVRIASYPQPVNAPVGTFVTGLQGSVSDIKVNELAQAMEFRTGLDLGHSVGKLGRFSVFTDIGGIGTLDPKQGVSVFKLPAADTPAGAQFTRVYGAPPTGAKYVAFSSPDRSRFYRTYGAGFRYTQLRFMGAEEDPNEKPPTGTGTTTPEKPLYRVLQPASVAISFGQNELVSIGSLRGVVMNVEAFFPFKLGGLPAYIFGRSTMSLRRNEDREPVFLDPAVTADGKPLAATDPGVYVITNRPNRDVYAIGIGIDALKMIELFSKKK